METQEFNTLKANIAQRKLCNDNKWPHFAPSANCYRCHKNIYEQVDHGTYKTGISVERAGKSLITGCPHCSYSFCD